MPDYRCTCIETTKPAQQMDYIEHLPLKGGSHTSVMPIICGLCHKMDFMPKENWDMFVARGETEVVKEWEEGFEKFVKKQQPVAKAVEKTRGFFSEFFATIFRRG